MPLESGYKMRRKQFFSFTVIGLLLIATIGFGSYIVLKNSVTNQPQQQVAEILRQAQQAQQDGNFEKSLQLIYQGLQIINGDAELLALRNTVETQRQQQLANQFKQRQANELLANAQAAFEEGELDKSRRLITQGLDLVSDHPGHLALRDTVQAKIAERTAQQQRSKDVSQLINQTQQTNDLDKKLELVDEGLRLMPNNRELQDLFNAIMREKLTLRSRREKLQKTLAEANALLQSGQFEQSLQLITIGLQDNPNHPELLALQATVTTEQTTAQQQQQRLEQLLAQAQQAEQADKLEESLRFIKTGLDIKSDDLTFIRLRDRVEQRLVEREAEQQQQQQLQQLLARAEQAQRDDQLEQSLALIGEGLQIVSDYQPLLLLREQIKTQQQQRATEERLQLEIETLLLDIKFAQLKGDYETALKHIKQGLQLDPANQQLLNLQKTLNQQVTERAEAQRQQQIATFLEQAQQAQQAGDFSASLAFIEQGLAMSPKQPELSELKLTVLDQMQAQQQRQRLANEAQANAEQALLAGLYDDSLDFIRRGLEQLPDDTALIKLRQRVVTEQAQVLAEQRRQQITTILTKAQQARQTNDLQAALAILEQGLNRIPNATELRDLQQTLTNVLTERKQRQDRVADLFEQAQQAQQRNEFSDSIALLTEGLKLSPNNQQLLELLKTIENQQQNQQQQQQLQRLTNDAAIQLQQDQADTSLALIEQGLRIDPSASELLRLQQEAFKLQKQQQWDRVIDKVDQLRIEAEKRLAAGDLAQAQALIDQGLSVIPDNRALQQLRADVLAKQAEQAAETEVVE